MDLTLTPEEQAFLDGPAHARFKASMDALGCRVVERIVGDRID